LPRCDKPVRAERTEWAAQDDPLRRSTRRDEFHRQEMPHSAITCDVPMQKCGYLEFSAHPESLKSPHRKNGRRPQASPRGPFGVWKVGLALLAVGVRLKPNLQNFDRAAG